jgi:hypothetical protein
MRKAYNIGEAVTLTGIFRKEDGELADPDIVTLKIKIPSGQIITFTPEQKSLGTFVYVYSLLAAEPGQYTYLFAGTGTVQAAVEDVFAVLESAFP